MLFLLWTFIDMAHCPPLRELTGKTHGKASAVKPDTILFDTISLKASLAKYRERRE